MSIYDDIIQKNLKRGKEYDSSMSTKEPSIYDSIIQNNLKTSQSRSDMTTGRSDIDISNKYDNRITPFQIESDRTTSELRGDNQTAWEQMRNGIPRAVLSIGTKTGNMVTTAVSVGTLGPSLLAAGVIDKTFGTDLITKETAYDVLFNNKVNHFFDAVEKEIKEVMPVYKSTKYQRGDLVDRLLTTSFVADDLADAAAFTAASLAMAPLSGMAGLTGATGLTGALVKGGARQLAKKGVQQGIASVNNSFAKNLGVKLSNAIPKSSDKLVTGLDNLTIGTLNALGEAGYEGREFEESFKEQLVEFELNKLKADEARKLGFTEEQISTMVLDDSARKQLLTQAERNAAAKIAEHKENIILSNLAILILPNYIQQEAWFGKNKGIVQQIKSTSYKNLANLDKQTGSISGSIGKSVLKNMASEGLLEEGSQMTVQNFESALMFEKQSANSIAERFAGLTSTYVEGILGDVDFQTGVAAGAIIGGLSGVKGGIREYKEDNAEYSKLAKILNVADAALAENFTSIYETEKVKVNRKSKDKDGNEIVTQEEVEKLKLDKDGNLIFNEKNVKNALLYGLRSGTLYDAAVAQSLEQNEPLEDLFNNMMLGRHFWHYVKDGELGVEVLKSKLRAAAKGQLDSGNINEDIALKKLSQKLDLIDGMFNAHTAIFGNTLLEEDINISKYENIEQVKTHAKKARFYEYTKQLGITEAIKDLNQEKSKYKTDLIEDIKRREVIEKQIESLNKIKEESIENSNKLTNKSVLISLHNELTNLNRDIKSEIENLELDLASQEKGSEKHIEIQKLINEKKSLLNYQNNETFFVKGEASNLTRFSSLIDEKLTTKANVGRAKQLYKEIAEAYKADRQLEVDINEQEESGLSTKDIINNYYNKRRKNNSQSEELIDTLIAKENKAKEEADVYKNTLEDELEDLESKEVIGEITDEELERKDQIEEELYELGEQSSANEDLIAFREEQKSRSDENNSKLDGLLKEASQLENNLKLEFAELIFDEVSIIVNNFENNPDEYQNVNGIVATISRLNLYKKIYNAYLKNNPKIVASNYEARINDSIKQLESILEQAKKNANNRRAKQILFAKRQNVIKYRSIGISIEEETLNIVDQELYDKISNIIGVDLLKQILDKAATSVIGDINFPSIYVDIILDKVRKSSTAEQRKDLMNFAKNTKLEISNMNLSKYKEAIKQLYLNNPQGLAHYFIEPDSRTYTASKKNPITLFLFNNDAYEFLENVQSTNSETLFDLVPKEEADKLKENLIETINIHLNILAYDKLLNEVHSSFDLTLSLQEQKEILKALAPNANSIVPSLQQLEAIRQFAKIISTKKIANNITDNWIYLRGIAGAGKTNIVAKWALRLLGYKTEEIISAAHNFEASVTINNSVNPENESINTVKDLINDFENLTKDKKILILDEVGAYERNDYADLINLVKELNDKRKTKGEPELKVLLLGDPTQITIEGTSPAENYNLSPNVMSLNPLTVAYRSNVSSIFNAYDVFQNNPSSVEKLITESSGEFNDPSSKGVNVVRSINDLKESVRVLKGNGQVKIIVVNNEKEISKYNDLVSEFNDTVTHNGVEQNELQVVTYDKVQGKTLPYVFIDIDQSKNNFNNEQFNSDSYNKAMYTSISRGTSKVVILDYSGNYSTIIKSADILNQENLNQAEIAENTVKLYEQINDELSALSEFDDTVKKPTFEKPVENKGPVENNPEEVNEEELEEEDTEDTQSEESQEDTIEPEETLISENEIFNGEDHKLLYPTAEKLKFNSQVSVGSTVKYVKIKANNSYGYQIGIFAEDGKLSSGKPRFTKIGVLSKKEIELLNLDTKANSSNIGFYDVSTGNLLGETLLEGKIKEATPLEYVYNGRIKGQGLFDIIFDRFINGFFRSANLNVPDNLLDKSYVKIFNNKEIEKIQSSRFKPKAGIPYLVIEEPNGEFSETQYIRLTPRALKDSDPEIQGIREFNQLTKDISNILFNKLKLGDPTFNKLIKYFRNDFVVNADINNFYSFETKTELFTLDELNSFLENDNLKLTKEQLDQIRPLAQKIIPMFYAPIKKRRVFKNESDALDYFTEQDLDLATYSVVKNGNQFAIKRADGSFITEGVIEARKGTVQRYFNSIAKANSTVGGIKFRMFPPNAPKNIGKSFGKSLLAEKGNSTEYYYWLKKQLDNTEYSVDEDGLPREEVIKDLEYVIKEFINPKIDFNDVKSSLSKGTITNEDLDTMFGENAFKDGSHNLDNTFARKPLQTDIGGREINGINGSMSEQSNRESLSELLTSPLSKVKPTSVVVKLGTQEETMQNVVTSEEESVMVKTTLTVNNDIESLGEKLANEEDFGDPFARIKEINITESFSETKISSTFAKEQVFNKKTQEEIDNETKNCKL